MMNELISSIMTTNVVALSPSDNLSQARDIMMSKHIHHIPIVENNKLVGMITAWDMFKLGKTSAELAETKISDVMTSRVAALDPDQHIGAAAEVLMEHLFHAVPIVNDNRELLGIVTTYDLLKYEYGKEYPDDLTRYVNDNM